MRILIRVQKKSELLVFGPNCVDMGKGFYLEDLVPVGIWALVGCAEDLEGGDHGGDAVQVWAQAMRSPCVFEGRFEVGLFVFRLC